MSSLSLLGVSGSLVGRCASLDLKGHWRDIEALLKKYKNRPISLADACLIRSAEVFQQRRILTFDSDFRIYRWGRNRTFELIA
jgi:predicted nucleic acid-binding protein